MKTLHCADLHIRERDVEEIDGCLSMIVRTAQEEHVDLAVIAGDIFDSRDIKLDSRSALMAIGFVSALADVCPVAIILGTPSHDGNAPAIMRHARGKNPVKVADRPEQWTVNETLLTLIPQPTKQYFQTQSDIKTADQEIGQALTGLFAGFGAQAAGNIGPHILVYHGGISDAKVSTGQTLTGQDIEVSTDQLNLSGADLNLCGHIHMAQQIGARTFYAGSPYRTNWGEMEPKGFYLHTITKGAGILEPIFIETPCKKVARYAFDYTASTGRLPDADAEDVAGAHVRIDATVWQDEAEKFDFPTMKVNLKRWGAVDVDIRIIRIPRENVRAEAVLKTERLRDKIQKMAELREEEVSWSTLTKAECLEDRQPDELLAAVGRAA